MVKSAGASDISPGPFFGKHRGWKRGEKREGRRGREGQREGRGGHFHSRFPSASP